MANRFWSAVVALTVFAAVSVPAGAQTADGAHTTSSAQTAAGVQTAAGAKGKIDISVGWGDQMFETLVWHEKSEAVGLLPASETINVNENYRYSQHWFLNGSYNVNSWFAVGAMLDCSGVSWNNTDYKGTGELLSDNGRKRFVNISVMPTATFTYMHKPHVQLHSALGAGLNVNTGTETDFKGRITAFAPAIYINTIGIRGTYGRFFANADLGGMISLVSKAEVYLIGSRLVSVSVGITL